MALSVWWNCWAHGHRVGNLRVGVPERFTAMAGTEMSRVRRVRLVVGGWSASWVVQHPRLWASTAHSSLRVEVPRVDGHRV